jgi:hypothetical protein
MDGNLRERYGRETGKPAYGQYPEIDYVEWLEQRIAVPSSVPAGEVAERCKEIGCVHIYEKHGCHGCEYKDIVDMNQKYAKGGFCDGCGYDNKFKLYKPRLAAKDAPTVA